MDDKYISITFMQCQAIVKVFVNYKSHYKKIKLGEILSCDLQIKIIKLKFVVFVRLFKVYI